ncbi:MAG: hypothetical protein ACI85L_002469 [Pseudomonadota bacterium]|jgi:hypothetical protein
MKKSSYPYLAIFLSILIFLLDLTGNIVFLFLVLGVFLVSAQSREKMFLIILFILPNQRILVFEDGGASILIVAILFYIIFSFKDNYFLINKSLRSAPFLISVVFVFYSFIYFYQTNSIYDLLIAIKFSIGIFFISLLYFEFYKNKYFIIKSIVFFSIGVIASAAYPIVEQGFGAIFTRLSSTGASPNNLAVLSAFSLVMIYFVIDLIHGFREKLFLYLLFFMVLIVGTLTQSRSFFLSFILIYLYIIFSFLKGRSFILSIGLLTLSLISFSIFINFLPNVFDDINQRIFEPKNGDISNSRFDLWLAYWNSFTLDVYSVFFGYGTDTLTERLGYDQVAHNYLIETLVSYGLFGSILIFLTYLSIVYNVTKKVRDYILFLPFIIINVSHFTGHGLISFEFGLKILLSALLYVLISIERINHVHG